MDRVTDKIVDARELQVLEASKGKGFLPVVPRNLKKPIMRRVGIKSWRPFLKKPDVISFMVKFNMELMRRCQVRGFYLDSYTLGTVIELYWSVREKMQNAGRIPLELHVLTMPGHKDKWLNSIRKAGLIHEHHSVGGFLNSIVASRGHARAVPVSPPLHRFKSKIKRTYDLTRFSPTEVVNFISAIEVPQIQNSKIHVRVTDKSQPMMYVDYFLKSENISNLHVEGKDKVRRRFTRLPKKLQAIFRRRK